MLKQAAAFRQHVRKTSLPVEIIMHKICIAVTVWEWSGARV
jgi:hypothetical protein